MLVRSKGFAESGKGIKFLAVSQADMNNRFSTQAGARHFRNGLQAGAIKAVNIEAELRDTVPRDVRQDGKVGFGCQLETIMRCISHDGKLPSPSAVDGWNRAAGRAGRIAARSRPAGYEAELTKVERPAGHKPSTLLLKASFDNQGLAAGRC